MHSSDNSRVVMYVLPMSAKQSSHVLAMINDEDDLQRIVKSTEKKQKNCAIRVHFYDLSCAD